MPRWVARDGRDVLGIEAPQIVFDCLIREEELVRACFSPDAKCPDLLQ
jgi:hypothetical protein